MLRTLACGALLAGTLAFAPLAQTQQSGGATGTTSGPASGKSSTGGNASRGKAAGNGAAGQPAKRGAEAGPARKKK